MAKRANGEGTIFQRKDGRWVGEAFVLLPNLGRDRRTVYGKSRAEVHEKVTALVRQAQQSIVAPHTRLTVEQYLTSWLEDVAKRTVRPRTYQNYELMVRRHIVPLLGRTRLDRITAADFRRSLNGATDKGLAASTVRHIHALLRVALEQALREDLVSRNVARLVQGPKKRTAPIMPLDVDEARRLLAAARNDRLYALWAVAIGVGLRKGEALGLAWTAVDLETGMLCVERTMQRIEGSLRLGEPKTERSQRSIRLPAVCVTALRRHAERQARKRASARYWADTGLVFTTQIGTAIDPRNVNRWLGELCVRAGVRSIRPPRPAAHLCVPAAGPGCAGPGGDGDPGSYADRRDHGHLLARPTSDAERRR